MKKSVKQKWIKALRSGKYKQYQGELTNKEDRNGEPYAYCCLGVLNRIRHRKQEYDHFGLTQEEESKLIKLNDDEGYTFKQIANYIEKNIKGE